MKKKFLLSLFLFIIIITVNCTVHAEKAPGDHAWDNYFSKFGDYATFNAIDTVAYDNFDRTINAIRNPAGKSTIEIAFYCNSIQFYCEKLTPWDNAGYWVVKYDRVTGQQLNMVYYSFNGEKLMSGSLSYNPDYIYYISIGIGDTLPRIHFGRIDGTIYSTKLEAQLYVPPPPPIEYVPIEFPELDVPIVPPLDHTLDSLWSRNMAMFKWLNKVYVWFINTLKSIPTPLGMSWFTLLFGLIIASILIDFFISFLKGESFQRIDTGDKIETSFKIGPYKRRIKK